MHSRQCTTCCYCGSYNSSQCCISLPLCFATAVDNTNETLWKATDQQGPPNVNITKFGWEVTEGIPSPCIVTGLHAPQGLIYVINCGCKAKGKACSTESCSCHKNNMACTVYSACSAVDELVDNKKRWCYPLINLTLMISCTYFLEILLGYLMVYCIHCICV